MPSAVWSGHLHFGLVAMPVRLLVAARTKTTHFRRLYRKPVDADPFATSFPSFSRDRQGQDSDPYGGIGKTRSTPEETDARHTEPYQYSTVHQVLPSERGEEIRPDELIKAYEIAPNEFAAIDPQEIKAAEIETSDTIDLFHFVKASEVDPIYQERVRKIIDAKIGNRIPMHPEPKTPTRGAPDLMEQIRLSLAELESKKPGSPKNQVRKTPTPEKKPQRVRA